jgi:M6 family metalloprotease-like protein
MTEPATADWRRRLKAGVVAFILLWTNGAAGAATALDLSQFKSPESAQRATLPLASHVAPTTGFVGIRAELDSQGKLVVAALAPDSPATAAGVRAGDLLVAIDGRPVPTPEAFRNLIRTSRAGQRLRLSLLRQELAVEVTVSCVPLASMGRPATRPADQPAPSGGLSAAPGSDGAELLRRGGLATRQLPLIRKDVLRIAVIGIDFADVHHNPQATLGDWGEAFFSHDTYRSKNATGQNVYGSVNDYYQEVSAGAMRVDGRVFDWVEVSKKRMDYYTPPPPGGPASRPALRSGGATYDVPLLREVLEKFLVREAPGVLNGFDGIAFLYAGLPAVRQPGSVYWPHTSGLIFRNRPMRYFIAYEGGRRMNNISVFCHETGHILGLPDLYASRSAWGVPGADPVGLGAWCLMSIQVGNGRPQHMSAWCKERLGWIKPAVVDPSVRQHLILSPIENSRTECFKVPLRPDGAEYLLLENRRHIGFDASVPAEGLLIWHVVGNRPILVEAHGLANTRAPWLNLRNIPYPTPRNDAYTPFSRPSSTTSGEGAIPLYLTDIRRLDDGRIAFSIGYGFD